MSSRNVIQKPNLPTWKGNPSPQCSARAYYSANALFRAGRCTPVRAHCQQVPKASSLAAEHQRPHCKQDECTSSFSPLKRKISLISKLVHRALMICTKRRFNGEIELIKKILLNNGYPKNVINAQIAKKIAVFHP